MSYVSVLQAPYEFGQFCLGPVSLVLECRFVGCHSGFECGAGHAHVLLATLGTRHLKREGGRKVSPTLF